MVQVLTPNERPSFAQSFASGFAQGIPPALEKYREMQTQKGKQAQEMQKLLMEYQLKGGLEEKKYDAKYAAKLNAIQQARQNREKNYSSQEQEQPFFNEDVTKGLLTNKPSYKKENVPYSREEIEDDSIIDPQIAQAKLKYNESLQRQREHEEKMGEKKLTREEAAIRSSYDAQKDFISETASKYRSFQEEFKPRLLQMQALGDDDLMSPSAALVAEQLGIPLGVLENPSNELYSKLSQDLLKGLPDTYGSRILKVEVDNFLKTIPQLINSPAGRRMIASNMLKLGEMKEVYYNEMRRQQKDLIDSNKRFPMDFQERVLDQVRPQIDKINKEFVKLAQIKDVPEGTVPFFNPSGDIEFVPKEHAQWAQENGGKRIW